MNDIKIILFDWDGTLNRDGLKHYVAKNDLIRMKKLDKYGISRMDLYKLKGVNPAELRGSHARKVGWQYFKKRYSAEINSIHRFLIYLTYEWLYFWNSSKYDFLFDNVQDVLFELKKKGYILGVATNKDAFIVKKQIKNTPLRNIFDVVLGSGNVLKMKPAPDIIFKALRKINKKRKLSIPISQVLMVGDDLEADIMAGKNAGCKTCLISSIKKDSNNKNSDIKKNIKYKPDFEIREIKEILSFL